MLVLNFYERSFWVSKSWVLQEQNFWKPCCSVHIILLVFKWLVRSEEIICSNILQHMDFNAWDDSWKGLPWDLLKKYFFQSHGSLPWVREAFNINAWVGTICIEVSFKNLVKIPSRPEALWRLCSCKRWAIPSLNSISYSKNISDVKKRRGQKSASYWTT